MPIGLEVQSHETVMVKLKGVYFRYHWFEGQNEFFDWCFECLSLHLPKTLLWCRFFLSKWWIFHFNFSNIQMWPIRYIGFWVTNRFYLVVYDANICGMTCIWHVLYLHFSRCQFMIVIVCSNHLHFEWDSPQSLPCSMLVNLVFLFDSSDCLTVNWIR